MNSTNARHRQYGSATVIHGDAWDVLKSAEPASFDAVLTDPPYSVGVTKNERDRPHWDLSRIAFDTSFWQEVRRVLKPGANLLAFGHPRTFARMSVAIEDAGFQIVDTLAWIHGQGYPAGYRHLDKELERVGASNTAGAFAGWGNILRPGFEPIVAARNLSSSQSLPEAIADGGVGGFNIDACRVPAGSEQRSRKPGRVSASAVWRIDRPHSTASTPSPLGRSPSNVLLQHHPACEIDLCSPGCPVHQVRLDGEATRGRGEDATRFYRSFHHHPKATAAERPHVGGIVGPAVKPIGIMDWLVQLSTQPGQLVLDPFAGTGTTLEACLRAGVRSVGIEREEAYLPLIGKRLAPYL
jgi:DNA modification methylase